MNRGLDAFHWLFIARRCKYYRTQLDATPTRIQQNNICKLSLEFMISNLLCTYEECPTRCLHCKNYHCVLKWEISQTRCRPVAFFNWYGLTLIPAWVQLSHAHYHDYGDGIAYLFPNFSGETIAVWRGISNSSHTFKIDVFTNPG